MSRVQDQSPIEKNDKLFVRTGDQPSTVVQHKTFGLVNPSAGLVPTRPANDNSVPPGPAICALQPQWSSSGPGGRYLDYLMTRLVGANDADDAAQDVRMVLLTSKPVIEPGKERAYISAVARNIARNRWRTSRRHPTLPLVDESVSVTRNAEDEVDNHRRVRALVDAMSKLRPSEQVAISWEEETPKFVDMLPPIDECHWREFETLSAASQRKRRERARRRLRLLLEELGTQNILADCNPDESVESRTSVNGHIES